MGLRAARSHQACHRPAGDAGAICGRAHLTVTRGTRAALCPVSPGAMRSQVACAQGPMHMDWAPWASELLFWGGLLPPLSRLIPALGTCVPGTPAPSVPNHWACTGVTSEHPANTHSTRRRSPAPPTTEQLQAGVMGGTYPHPPGRARWPSTPRRCPCAGAGRRRAQCGSLGWEDPLEKGTATHSSILAWRIPRTEEIGRAHV